MGQLLRVVQRAGEGNLLRVEEPLAREKDSRCPLSGRKKREGCTYLQQIPLLVGRLMTSPWAPSWLSCAERNSIVLRKFGSRRLGCATRSWPVRFGISPPDGRTLRI